MAPPKANSHRAAVRRKKSVSFLQSLQDKYLNVRFFKYLLLEPAAVPLVAIFILLAETVINLVVIQRVPYTEIDWVAYMQECEGFLNGTTNYALLRGDTGPLVYPAAFVYIYSALYYLTSHGANVRLAQYIFAGIYLLQLALVLRLYSKSRKVPPYVLVLSAFTSYRIHSIYVLRLFNDPVAVVLFYASLNLFMDRRWTFGSVFFSLAVGVKMNILLFAPALFLFYLANLGLLKTLLQLVICGSVQLLLGAPFLLTHPLEYLRGSFDLGRIFEHKWTVNYRFLTKELFENRTFHLSLLGLHLLLLLVFAKPTWTFFQSYVRLRRVEDQLQPQIANKNREVKTQKKLKKAEKDKDQEKLTIEQQAFLKSFEKTLQKSAGAKASPAPPASQSEPERYGIHFDRCTQLALLPFFLSNLIGVACARSLHYQFYVWYFHSLPYLAWSTPYSLGVRCLILGLIEYCWNTYPSTNFSSAALHVSHILLLGGIAKQLFQTMRLNNAIKKDQQQQKKVQ
ncbi:lethal(2)neighbour of tid protein [Drosophila serrata]|uniref:lethal(2)neighbour of tid protein n=1 Tax=Drosophila serrata TaxID=7274 RepID=UPI000A1D362D|nr:lethal(2)neighbour of tid protein [Drosophila serrata]